MFLTAGNVSASPFRRTCDAEMYAVNQEEVEALSRHLVEEKDRCIAHEKEIRNLKKNVKAPVEAESLRVLNVALK